MQKHHFKKVALQDETSENFKRKRKREKNCTVISLLLRCLCSIKLRVVPQSTVQWAKVNTSWSRLRRWSIFAIRRAVIRQRKQKTDDSLWSRRSEFFWKTTEKRSWSSPLAGAPYKSGGMQFARRAWWAGCLPHAFSPLTYGRCE